MRPLPALATAAALVAACGGGAPIPAAEVLLHVTSGVAEVELGRGFDVTVVRVWERNLVPEAWDDRALAPLSARLAETRRREDGRRVEETRRYLCHAFDAGLVVVPAPSFTATPAGGGTPRTARGDALTLRVHPTLDAAAPGPPELPGGPLEEPTPWLPWGAVILAAGLATALLVARRRRRAAGRTIPSATPPAAAVESPAAVSLRRLAGLRGRADAERVSDETARIVRDFLVERFGVPANERTTDEVLSAVPFDARGGAAAPSRDDLRDVLGSCDRVKFARHLPSAPEIAHLLSTAERFVRAHDDAPVPGASAPGESRP